MKFINLLFIIGVIGLIMSCSSDELDSQFQEKVLFLPNLWIKNF